MDRCEKGFVLFLFMVFGLLASVNGKRIKDSIYDDLNERAFCFRRTNGTNQMGCSSTPGGNVGVVHLISNNGDTDWLIGDQGIHAPYIAIIIPKMFTKETLAKLKSSGKIDGILLLGANNTKNDLGVDLAPPSEYSDDSSCPNQKSSYYKEQACKEKIWNPFGSDILLEDWSFPIFLVDDHEKVTGLVNCYNDYNKPSDSTPRSWPLCAAELKSHMISSVDTKTCLRRNSFTNPFSPTNFCDQMGDRNVFYMIHQENMTEDRYPDQSILVVSARLDGVNIFDKMEVGYGSPSSNIITLLATAELLLRDDVNFQLKSKKNVLFALLNGESFDYIGSSRMVYDMEEGSFPKPDDDDVIDDDKVKTLDWPKIDLNSLYGHLELGELLKTSESDKTYYAHMDKNNSDLNQNHKLLSTLETEAGKIGLTLEKSNSDRLPPSSIHSILKRKNNIPGILLSNFDSEFTNQYYHSIYDNSTSNGYDHNETNQAVVEHLATVAETVTATIFELFGNKNPGQPSYTFKGKANRTLINDLIYCYTVTSKCNMFEAVKWNEELPDFPLPQYVGVKQSYTYHTTFTYRVLAYLTSKPIEDQNTTCKASENQTIYHYQPIKGATPPSWFSGNKTQCDANSTCGYCLKSTVWFSSAVSPAFVINDYDYHNTTYGSWAESSWPRETSSRMFLKADPSREAAYLSLGIIMLLLSFTSVIWINIHATDIFEEGEQQVEPAAI